MRWRTGADDDDEWYDEDEDYGPEPYVIVREGTMGIAPFLLGIALGARLLCHVFTLSVLYSSWMNSSCKKMQRPVFWEAVGF